ncbi:MAG: OmpA family protein [Bacteroidota bacterium]
MNLRFSIVILVVLLVSSFQVHAQTSQTPVTTGLSASFLDYQGPLTGNYTDFNSFNPGITIGANAFLSEALNFGLNTTFVPQTTYPVTQTETIGTSLIDVNALLQLKSNGTIFQEESFFAPYLSVGFGLNTASNNLRLYVPGAFGIRLRMSKNFALNFEGMYKYGIGEGNFQPLTYSAGFVFALPANPKKVPPKQQKQPKKEEMPIASNADADNDGVLDRDDLCPNEPGRAMFLGCPEDESAKEEKPSDIALTQDNELENTQGSESMSIVEDNQPQPAQIENYEETPAEIYTEQDTYKENTYTEGQGISSADQSILNTAMRNILFEPASDELTYESYPVLDQVADLMNKYPNHSLEVHGFTDNTGKSKDNKVLSVKRAYKVKYYLVYQKGIRMARISSDGYGDASPISTNDSAEGRKQNRRVELRMFKSEADSLGLRSN